MALETFDNTEYLVNGVRGIKRYITSRRQEIENYKIPEDAQGSRLQQEKAFIGGAIKELEAIEKFIDTLKL